MPQIVINQAGPLPITATVQTGSTGPATLTLSGSVWSPNDTCMIGIAVMMEGQPVGEAMIFSNNKAVHRAVVSMHFAVDLDKPFTGDPPTTPPTYTIELLPMNANTTSDQNDWFQVTLLA